MFALGSKCTRAHGCTSQPPMCNLHPSGPGKSVTTNYHLPRDVVEHAGQVEATPCEAAPLFLLIHRPVFSTGCRTDTECRLPLRPLPPLLHSCSLGVIWSFPALVTKIFYRRCSSRFTVHSRALGLFVCAATPPPHTGAWSSPAHGNGAAVTGGGRGPQGTPPGRLLLRSSRLGPWSEWLVCFRVSTSVGTNPRPPVLSGAVQYQPPRADHTR